MNDLIKRIDDYMQGAGEELATVILNDCKAALEAKGEAVKYWLCCGNTNPTHDGRCHELLIGNKHHVRYGTKKEHSDWQKSLYTTPPSVDLLIAEIDALPVHHFHEKTEKRFINLKSLNATLDKYRSAK